MGTYRSTTRGFASILAFLIFSLAACAEDPTGPDLLIIELGPDPLLLEIGDSTQITSVVRDGAGRVVQRSLAWSISDTSVVALSELGVLRARAPGNALVIGTVNARADTVRVTVNARAPSIIAVTPDVIEAGSAGLTLSITGTRFLRSSKVHWNGQERTTTWVDSAHLSVAIPSSDLAQFALANVTVSTPPPGGGTSSPVSVNVGLAVRAMSKTISAGERFTCAITIEGRSHCWGRNLSRFGDGTSSSSTVPVASAGGHIFHHISAAKSWVAGAGTRTGGCALTMQGEAYCWGDNLSGQLGTGTLNQSSSSAPARVVGGLTFGDLAVGYEHVCGVTAGGAAYCWGSDYNGQLGDGRRGSPGLGGVREPAPIPVPGTHLYIAIAAGERHTCALTRNGDAYCWGVVGFLGNGEAREAGATPTVRTPVLVSGGHKFARISAGPEHTCAITVPGHIYCWGGGQVSGTDARVPTLMASGPRYTDISVGAEHTCAVATDGSAYCWGHNDYGQLGTGTINEPNVWTPPARVVAAVALESISAGTTHSCATGVDGHAYCWGSRGLGELGNDAPIYSNALVPVSGPATLRSIGAGGAFACTADAAGRAYCSGLNTNGELGIGSKTGPENCLHFQACSTRPLAVPGATTITSVAAGSTHACALTAAGQAYCWGNNFYGQLGDGTTTTRESPIPVAGSIQFRSLAASASHTCGIATDNNAYCWGANNTGRLGDGTTVDRTVPRAVAGGLAFASLTAGGSHTCALTTSRELYCWGLDNLGQLAGAGTEDCVVEIFRSNFRSLKCSRSPVRVAAQFVFESIVAGGEHACGLVTDGSGFCWGMNSTDQLGAATTEQCDGGLILTACSRSPIAIPIGSPLRTLSAGPQHTCALNSAGRLFCWGRVVQDVLVAPLGRSPVTIDGPAFLQLSSGAQHVCAIAADERAYCFGLNDAGQLGNGVLPFELTPVRVNGGLRF